MELYLYSCIRPYGEIPIWLGFTFISMLRAVITVDCKIIETHKLKLSGEKSYPS
jgi:hypothetical protein